MIFCLCPEPSCGVEFGVAESDAGRFAICSACHREVTAIPTQIWPKLRQREKRAAKAGATRLASAAARVVALDHVRSQWNVGSIFRTADGAAWEHVVLSGITASPPSEGITKTALGAEKHVPWSYHSGNVAVLEALKAQGFAVVGLEQTKHSIPLSEFQSPERLVLILGNEIVGVSPEVLRRCDEVVHIPMFGKKESLNVAVAFGIAAFALRAR